MSHRPIKKSDLDKEWMKPRNNKQKLIAPEYHLIICEGTKTEPNYFEGLKKEINDKYNGKISIETYGEGKNTLTLLDRAIELVKNNKNTIKHVWLVYDKDDFPKDDFDNTNYKCKSIKGTKYHAIWSNQCIELWFLLHFSYFQADIHRTEYYDKINDGFLNNKINGKYKKNDDNIYYKLKPYLNIAIENAKKLEKNYNVDVPSKMSPCTKVYEIFEKLEVYLKN